MVGINFERGVRRESEFESAITFLHPKSSHIIVYVLQGILQ